MLKALTDPLTDANTTYVYDGAGRVASRTDSAGMYAYDGMGNRTSWLNHRRLLKPIGYVPPAEFEAAYWSLR